MDNEDWCPECNMTTWIVDGYECDDEDGLVEHECDPDPEDEDE